MVFVKFIVYFVLLFLGSCTKLIPPSKQTENAPPNRYLNISFHTEVQSFDPRVGIDYPTIFALKMLFEGLMYIGPDKKPHPAIAESYEISSDGKTYIFHLRPTYWSNGDKVTAYDFAYSWKKVIDPDHKALTSDSFYPIKNVGAILKREKPLDTVGITVLNANTLKIELENPTPYFLELLATSPYFPVNAQVDKKNKDWAHLEGNAFVCNGPFHLKKHLFNNEIIVEKNPHFWDEEKVRLPGIRISIIRDSQTQLNLFEKKKLDWFDCSFTRFPLDAMPYLKKAGKIQFQNSLGVFWLFINTQTFPFNNKKLRKAFAYAVNRAAITQNILEGGELPAMGVLPTGLATQNTPFFADNNTDLALTLFNEALEEFGLKREDLPAITLNMTSNASHIRVAQALQQQWSQVFQIPILLEHQEWRSHYAKLQMGNFQMGGMGWQSWLRDPIYILKTFRYQSDGLNMSHWENKQYQDLLASAERELDPLKRKQFFNEAEALLMEEMPVIPIFFMVTGFGKTSQLKNVYLSDLYEMDFRWAYFDE